MPNRAIRINGAVLDAWKRVTGIELDDGAAANSAVRTAVTLPAREAAAAAHAMTWLLDNLQRGVLRGLDGTQAVVPDLAIAAEGDEVNIRDSSGRIVAVLSPGSRVVASRLAAAHA